MRIETRILLRESLEIEWTMALPYFLRCSPFEREDRKAHFFALSMKNLGYTHYETFTFLTSGVLFMSLFEVGEVLKNVFRSDNE